jgi:hypothetical protein
VSSKLNNPSNRSEAGFQVSFSKDGGRSTIVADFFSEGQSSQSAFKDDTSFDVKIKLSTGDSLEIDVETMFEGRDGVLMSSGYHEYPFTQNKEIYTINYKNTNGTSSLDDDVLINAKHNGSGLYSSSLDTYKGKDSGSHYYKSELGLLNYTYGGSWEDSPSVSGGSGRGTYLADYEGFYVKYDYTQSGGETELFTFNKVKYDNDELVIELASHRTEAPEAPEGYEHYFDRYFEAESVGPLNPSLMKTVFEEDMLPLFLGGNNVITGGSGDDVIDGGAGTDIAVYRGKFADYNFTKNESNLWVIRDTQSGRDGTDTIQNIETLSFSDKKSVTVGSWVPPVPGVVSIKAVYDDDAGAFGLYLTSNKALVIASSGLTVDSSAEGAITLLAANGKNFAFKPAANNSLLVDLSNSNPAKTYSIVYGKDKSWSQQFFNDEGVAVGRATKITYSKLLSLESEFNEDIDVDESIGDSISFVFDNGLDEGSAHGLYRTLSGALIIDSSGLSVNDQTDSPTMLMSGSKLYNTKSTTVSLVSYEDGFGLITGSGKVWSEQEFSSEGLALGRATKLTLPQLLAKESEMDKDLNGSGSIGDSVSVVLDDGLDENSAYGLYRTESGALIIDSSGLSVNDQTDSPTMLMSGSKLYNTKSTTVSLVSYEDGFGLITGSGTKWTEQLFDGEGKTAGSAKKLNLLQILDKELEVEEDLDGDELIGNIITEVGASSDNWQVYKTKTNTFVLESTGLFENDSISTDAIDLLSSGTRSWAIKSGSIEGLVEIDDQYIELLVQSGTSYTAQKFNLDTGIIYGRALKLNDAALQAREYAYDQDLNNDGEISLIGQTSAPTDWVI